MDGLMVYIWLHASGLGTRWTLLQDADAVAARVSQGDLRHTDYGTYPEAIEVPDGGEAAAREHHERMVTSVLAVKSTLTPLESTSTSDVRERMARVV
jgi:hypothetical protein